MNGVKIQNVSDTARWVAMYRAYETERPDAHFHDPFARRLAGPDGEAIMRSVPGGMRTSWPMVVRTVAIDGFITRAVNDDGVDTVLNLAAGLDARPWRMELPASLHWIDVDLPEILGYKQRELANETLAAATRRAPSTCVRRRRGRPCSPAWPPRAGARSCSPRGC